MKLNIRKYCSPCGTAWFCVYDELYFVQTGAMQLELFHNYVYLLNSYELTLGVFQ